MVLAAKNRCMQVHWFNLDQDGSSCVAQLYMLCFSAEMSYVQQMRRSAWPTLFSSQP